MADFFSGSLQSRAARGNFQSMAGSPAYESRYISFDEFIRSKGPEAAMRARDPISFRGLWSEYSNRYPQSARIAVTQDAFRQMGGESPIEQGLRQAGDYRSYMQQMKAAGAEEFMLTPQSFAASDVRKREKGRETMQEFYKGRGTGEKVGDMSPDAGFKRRDGEKMIKVPVGPRGELQLENIKGGERATRFRMIPESEVDRMRIEQGKAGLGVRQIGVDEKRMEETEKMQEAEPRLREQENILSGYEETEKKRSERYKLEGLIEQDADIRDNPEYGALVAEAYTAVASGVSAENAMRDLRSSAQLPEIKVQRQRESERLREERSQKSKLEYLERATGYKKEIYNKQQEDRREIEKLKLAGDLQQAAMVAQRADEDAIQHLGALGRALETARANLNARDPVEDAQKVMELNGTISKLLQEQNEFLEKRSYYESVINAAPAPGSLRVPEYQVFGGQPQPTAPASGASNYVMVRLSNGSEVRVLNTPAMLNGIRQRDPGAQIIGSM